MIHYLNFKVQTLYYQISIVVMLARGRLNIADKSLTDCKITDVKQHFADVTVMLCVVKNFFSQTALKYME